MKNYLFIEYILSLYLGPAQCLDYWLIYLIKYYVVIVIILQRLLIIQLNKYWKEKLEDEIEAQEKNSNRYTLISLNTTVYMRMAYCSGHKIHSLRLDIERCKYVTGQENVSVRRHLKGDRFPPWIAEQKFFSSYEG